MPDLWVPGPNGFRFYPGDFRDIIDQIEDDAYDCIITDPPYSKETHEGARTDLEGDITELVDFDYLTLEEVYEHLGLLSRVCRRWLIATMDWRHITPLEAKPPRGWRFVRFGIWCKSSYAPQVSGDRPATGWEGIAMLHRDERGRARRMHWNGGGKSAVYHDTKPQKPVYPTQKPVSLLRKFVRDFRDPGGRILDPYGGSGTTGVAALLEGHEVDLCERKVAAHEILWRRVSAVQAEGTMAVPLVEQGRLFG